MYLGQAVLKRLAVLTLAVQGGAAGGFANVGAELESVQPQELTDLIEPSSMEELEPRSRTGILRVVAHDRRSAIRHHLASHLGRYELPPTQDTLTLLADLAHDESPTVQRTMAIELGRLLETWPPLKRTFFIADWALSSDPDLRLAMARALCLPSTAVGARTALRVLSRDPLLEVRRAALSAARLRRVALS